MIGSLQNQRQQPIFRNALNKTGIPASIAASLRFRRFPASKAAMCLCSHSSPVDLGRCKVPRGREQATQSSYPSFPPISASHLPQSLLCHNQTQNPKKPKHPRKGFWGKPPHFLCPAKRQAQIKPNPGCPAADALPRRWT